jgi:hypothetical protein
VFRGTAQEIQQNQVCATLLKKLNVFNVYTLHVGLSTGWGGLAGAFALLISSISK